MPRSQPSAWPFLFGAGACALGLSLHVLKRKQPEDLHGRTALITGGSRGLGLALASELVGKGCRIALAARSAGELDHAKAKLLAKKPDADIEVFVCDLTSTEGPHELVQRVTTKFGRIDILINNAGIIEVSPLDALRLDDFERAMDLMFFAHLRAILAVLPQMIERHDGHIVNVSSIGGRVSVPRLLPYCCAKFALTGLSEGLSVELKQKNIHVLTVIQTASQVALQELHRSEAEYRGAIVLIEQQARRLSRIVEDMFVLARADAGQRILQISEFYLDELLAETARAAGVLARQKNLDIELRPLPEVLYRGDEHLIRQMTWNLLDNAVKHTPGSGRICIELQARGTEFVITVEDTGHGIAREDQAYIFERFYRGDPARSRAESSSGSGAGLGLPIAISGALWLYLSEYEDWRFALASRRLDEAKPAAAYGLVHDALAAAQISLEQTPARLILRTSDPFLRALRRIFKNTTAVEGMRLGGQLIADRFVVDALVYRIR